MITVDFVRKLFEYDAWANQQALASLSTVSEAEERPRKLFAHVIGAQHVWLARFENPAPPSAQPWPVLSVSECRACIDELHGQWMKLLSGLTPEKLADSLVYRNTKGDEYRTPIGDVLMHLVMHSAYHRGQVAAAVRQAGGKPAATDYVVYVRKTGQMSS